MLTSSSPRLLPRVPPTIRFGLLGTLLASLVYVTVIWQPEKAVPEETIDPAEPVVVVPQLDMALLAQANDETREDRLRLEAEPLRHLLSKAIDVGPSTAVALGTPGEQVSIADLRTDVAKWRSRWIWFEGVLEDLGGPRDGNPVRGYSIYEATIRLADGNHAMTAFSIPPDNDIQLGSWVKVEGFLLKLRDTTYPLDITMAPMLVGRELRRDYEDWGPITELDATLLDSVNDRDYWPGTKSWHTLEEDQTEALWHLAAFVRDTAKQRSLADWRKIGTLNAAEVYDRLLDNAFARGTPLRIFGTLIRRRTLAAPPNPAGITFWTIAWIQVREFGGRLIPVWLPKRVDNLPARASLEVRGFYYRWLAYEGQKNDRFRVPLFVAADLDPYKLEVDKTMRALGLGLGALLIAMMGLFWLAQRRAHVESVAHARDMDTRRRRRRERAAGAIPSKSSPAP